MAEHFISKDDAREDLLAAAAYIGERVKSGDGHAQAMLAIVPRYLAHGNVDLAAELANSVDDPFTRDKLLTDVAEKCAELDDDEYALQLADTVEEFGLRSQAFERVALQKVHKGQIEKAIEISDSMSHPDLIFASAAARLAAEGKQVESRAIMERIEFPSATVSALQAMAMDALAADKKDECISLLDKAKDVAADIEHNEERIRTLCDLGNHYVEAGRNDLAIGAFDAARQAAEQLDNMHRDPLIALAIMGFLNAGSPDTADRALDLVTDKTQMAASLLAFAKYYWSKGARDDALEALDEAYQILRSQRDFETRDSRARYALFVQIAAQFAGFEKGERAIEIAQYVDDEPHRTAALSQVAAVLTLLKEDDLARSAINSIGEDADRAFALINMSDAKNKNGDRSDSVRLLNEAMHMIEDVPQFTSRAAAYNELAKRYSEYGETQKAMESCSASLETTAQIRDEGNRVVSLAALSDVASSNSDIELTEEDRQLLDRLMVRT